MSARAVAVVVGNPRPASRTLTAAQYVATSLAGRSPDLVVDLAALGPALLDWDDDHVADLVAEVAAAELIVVASPTYKATYTGLLKLFLDRFPAGSITGLAVPLMLGASPVHALAPELALRPLLTELGATTVRGLHVTDTAYDDPDAYTAWFASVRPAVDRFLTPGVLV